jgi:hypothetical protein
VGAKHIVNRLPTTPKAANRKVAASGERTSATAAPTAPNGTQMHSHTTRWVVIASASLLIRHHTDVSIRPLDRPGSVRSTMALNRSSITARDRTTT